MGILTYTYIHGWALVHKTTYAPMVYTAPCVMLLMRAASITWARGRGMGSGNLKFFGPQMALAYRLDAISQGPKNAKFPGFYRLPHRLFVLKFQHCKYRLSGRYDNPVPTRFFVPIDCSKFPALYSSTTLQ
jgi:hypothetical protein